MFTKSRFVLPKVSLGLLLAVAMLFSALGPGIFALKKANAATVLFSDSFGGTNTNTVTGWIDSDGPGNKAKIDTSSPRSGSPTTGHARLREGASITKTISTVGYENITLNYYWRGDSDAERDDRLRVYWKKTTDSSFVEVNSHNLNQNTNSWSSQVSINLPVGASDTSIDIKFLGDTNQSNEEARVDDVSIVAVSNPILVGNMETVCTSAGFDFGIAKYEWKGGSWQMEAQKSGYNTSVSGSASSANWKVNDPNGPGADGVISKQATSIINHNQSGTSGTINKGQHDISFIVLCGNNPTSPPASPTGTIRVCKIILDSDGNIVTGNPGTTFTIPWLNENYEGPATKVLQPAVFNTAISLNTSLFGDSAKKGECKEHENLSTGTYYYGQEQITPNSSAWEIPKYHDGYTALTGLGDFGLFNTDPNPSNDNFDGVIVLGPGQTRTLVVLNQMKKIVEPQEPKNSCVVPNTLEDANPVSFGVSPEKTLQQILNEKYGLNVIDAVNDETNIQIWSVPANTASVTFTANKIASFAGYTNAFGYYTNSNLSTIVPVAYGVPTTISTTGVSSIGFALISNTGSVINNYATEKSLNSGGNDQAFVYNHANDTYVIAFEDINPLNSSDRDYNDLVVEVVINECPKVPAVCEPGKELIINGGFEIPIVTNGANWDVFTSVLGWSFDWMNPNQNAPAPTLELHRGVLGWLSAKGSQHAELDGDWFGPSNSGQGGSTKLWQEIATVPGKKYELKFAFSARPNTGDADNKLGVKINGTDITGSPFVKSNNTGQTAWEYFTHKFTATSALTKIKFEDRGTENALGTFLDDVSLVCLKDCVETGGSVVSDGTVINVTDGNIAAKTLSFIHPGWTANIPGATWIWATDPVESPTNDADLTKVFTKTFNVVGTPTAGTLDIAADNYYSVKINGNPVGSELVNENNFQLATQDSYNVTSFLVNGANTIEITATNKEVGESPDPASNPAGILFKLSWTAEDCGDNPPPPQEKEKRDVTFHKFIDGRVATQGEFEIEYGTPTFNGDKITLKSSNSFNQTISVEDGKTLFWKELTGGNTGVLPFGTECTAGNYGKYILKGYTFAQFFNDAKNLVPNNNASAVISLNSHVIVWNEYCPEPTNGGGGNGPFTLTLIIFGDGNGSVLGQNDEPNGEEEKDFFCEKDGAEEERCEEEFPKDTIVNLSAIPFEGSNFNSSWSESCSGTGSCQIVMDSNKLVKAHFAKDGTLIIDSVTSTGGGGGSSGSRRQNPPLVLGATDQNPDGEVLGATVGLPNTGRAEEPVNSTNSLIALFAISVLGLVALNSRSLKLVK